MTLIPSPATVKGDLSPQCQNFEILKMLFQQLPCSAQGTEPVLLPSKGEVSPVEAPVLYDA